RQNHTSSRNTHAAEAPTSMPTALPSCFIVSTYSIWIPLVLHSSLRLPVIFSSASFAMNTTFALPFATAFRDCLIPTALLQFFKSSFTSLHLSPLSPFSVTYNKTDKSDKMRIIPPEFALHNFIISIGHCQEKRLKQRGTPSRHGLAVYRYAP